MLGNQWVALANTALAPVNVRGTYIDLRPRAYGDFVWYQDRPDIPARVGHVTQAALNQALALIGELTPPTPEQLTRARTELPTPGVPDPVAAYISGVLDALRSDLARLPGDPGGELGAYAVRLLEELGAPPGAVEQFLIAWTPTAAALTAVVALRATTADLDADLSFPVLMPASYEQWRQFFFGPPVLAAAGVAQPPLAVWDADPTARVALNQRLAAAAGLRRP